MGKSNKKKRTNVKYVEEWYDRLIIPYLQAVKSIMSMSIYGN